MKQYQAALRQIKEDGSWQENRTGIRTLSTVGVHQRYDLADGFPATTTKKLAFQSVKGELAGFLRGATSAATFRELKCKIWDQNANENKDWLNNPFRQGEDHLGPVYGAQWRQWNAFKKFNSYAVGPLAQKMREEGWIAIAEDANFFADSSVVYHKQIDQIEYCINEILNNPTNRRILFHGWNWAELDEMALPPCHLLYQFHPNIEKKELSMSLLIRSNDFGLGTPFNIASAALLLSIIARLTGYAPRVLSILSNDAHIYENHMEMIDKVLEREPLALPTLKFADSFPTYEKLAESFQGKALTGAVVGILDNLDPDDFTLEGYEHHPPITAPMAV